jgi:serine phosphatase RsbU (regulator of sigma subunit)
VTTAETTEGARILVVDDTEANRDLLARRLQRQGHTTEMAVNGREALDMLNASAFDLVLLDIMMPVMNGYELLELMQAHDTLQHVPVILISALDDAESMAKGIAMGADDHLPKPFNPHILRARVGASLARKRLRDREQMYARSLEREMDIARDIQAGFLPDQLPVAPGWNLAAYFQPARRVGGDFYDAFALPGGQRIAIVVADVCDKGVGAALFMALFRSLVRALAERMLTTDGDAATQARQLIASVNDYIARTHSGANMFATLFFSILDPATGSLVYVNGGHEAPAIIGTVGVRARLDPTGPAVGMLPDMAFKAKQEAISPGETLVIFTDGVTDSRDADGALFSEQRLLDLLAQPAPSAAATLEQVRAAVQAHAGDGVPFDDITLFAAQRAG